MWLFCILATLIILFTCLCGKRRVHRHASARHAAVPVSQKDTPPVLRETTYVLKDTYISSLDEREKSGSSTRSIHNEFMNRGKEPDYRTLYRTALSSAKNADEEFFMRTSSHDVNIVSL